MASVLFSTLGQAVGGPLGAAVGATVGSTVDGAFLGRGRANPGDLLIQRSSYGETFPRLYGTTRQAGLLLWALPLTLGGGGKGGDRPAYVSSFAIALSSRPIVGIGRIWADGREIRNSEGQFESETNFRVHVGAGLDGVDQAIASAEGIGYAPAYSGLAYVVFEDFSLAIFGNRIPNLSFEVIADEPAETPGNWLQDFARQAGVDVQSPGNLKSAIGYSSGQLNWRTDFEALAKIANLSETYRAGSFAFSGSDRVFAISSSEICVEDSPDYAFGLTRTTAFGERPNGFTITYFDPERDYQAGSQRAIRGATGRMLESMVGVTATADMSRTLANRFLRQAEAAVAMLEASLSWRWCEISVGDLIQIDDQVERWRVVRKDMEGMRVHLTCQLEPSGAAGATRASVSGRALAAPMVAAQPTIIDAYELPMPVAGKGGGGIWVAASGSAGWRGAEISWALEGGDWVNLGASSETLIRGTLTSPLTEGPEQLWDEKSILELVLDEEDHWLESRSRRAVLDGSNFLRVGDELVQYCQVDSLGDRKFRLTGLLRGRFGTGFANSLHPAGTRVEKFDPETLAFQEMWADTIGQDVIVRASGRGDPIGGSATEVRFSGFGHAPLGPCHVNAVRKSNGDIEIVWKVRDRSFFEWTNSNTQIENNFICCLREIFGDKIIEKRTAETLLVYSLAQQIEDFQHALRSIVICIYTEGNGPIDIRSSSVVESII